MEVNKNEYKYDDGIFCIEARVYLNDKGVNDLSIRFSLSNPAAISEKAAFIISEISESFDMVFYNLIDDQIYNPRKNNVHNVIRKSLKLAYKKIASIGLPV